jgi:phosphate transport system protein
MARHLELELDALKRKLLALSAIVEETVGRSVKSLSLRDEKLGRQVVEADKEIDLIEVDLEEDCLKILALHQPVALDLRVVIAALKINNDLERVGDLAVNIAQRAIALSALKPVEVPFDFDTMAKKTRAMLRQSLDSLIDMDVRSAHEVCRLDDEIDAMNRDMYGKVFASIRKNVDDLEAMILYHSAARHLERIADYATNIAEDVIYMIEGTIVRHKP